MKASTIRKTQLIFNSGPGAIVETSEWSGVVASLSLWSLDKLQRVPRKSRRGLGVLVKPPIVTKKIGFKELFSPNGIVPVKRFPIWVQCSNPKCATFGPYYFIKSQTDEFKCVACESGKLVPARLIRICPKGHIDDFPWEQFYHGDEACTVKSHPKMTLVSSENQTGALSDLTLKCKCDLHPKGLNLGVVYNFPLAKGCTGNKPWLDGDRDTCRETSLVVLRGASNVYFPEIKSEITIPGDKEKFQRFYEDDLTRYHDLFVGASEDDLRQTLGLPAIASKMQSKGIVLGDMVKHIIELLGSVRREIPMESDIRLAEHAVLLNPSIVREDIQPKVFSAKKITLDAVLKRFKLDSLVKVNRLQEIRILQGFRRVYPNSNGGQVDLIDFSSETDGIYPAVEINGEGIFLSLSEEHLKKWESRSDVRKHCETITLTLKSNNSFRDLPFDLTPRAILLHSLAHALIKQLALYGGYSSVSIREKIYSFSDANGILIYTGESDSEGTMGGIVSVCDPIKFHQIFEEAIEEAKWCSSDPVCSENAHDQDSSHNLAACHACLFLSETSCEVSNRYLDRKVLIDEAIGFFGDI